MQLGNGRLDGNLSRILKVLLKETEGEQAYSLAFSTSPSGFSQVCGKLQERFPNVCLKMTCHRMLVQDHFTTPQAFSVALSTSRFLAVMGTSGRRYSSSHRPIITSAAFTGTGFVSMNRSLKIG